MRSTAILGSIISQTETTVEIQELAEVEQQEGLSALSTLTEPESGVYSTDANDVSTSGGVVVQRELHNIKEPAPFHGLSMAPHQMALITQGLQKAIGGLRKTQTLSLGGLKDSSDVDDGAVVRRPRPTAVTISSIGNRKRSTKYAQDRRALVETSLSPSHCRDALAKSIPVISVQPKENPNLSPAPDMCVVLTSTFNLELTVTNRRSKMHKDQGASEEDDRGHYGLDEGNQYGGGSDEPRLGYSSSNHAHDMEFGGSQTNSLPAASIYSEQGEDPSPVSTPYVTLTSIIDPELNCMSRGSTMDADQWAGRADGQDQSLDEFKQHGPDSDESSLGYSEPGETPAAELHSRPFPRNPSFQGDPPNGIQGSQVDINGTVTRPRGGNRMPSSRYRKGHYEVIDTPSGNPGAAGLMDIYPFTGEIANQSRSPQNSSKRAYSRRSSGEVQEEEV